MPRVGKKTGGYGKAGKIPGRIGAGGSPESISFRSMTGSPKSMFGNMAAGRNMPMFGGGSGMMGGGRNAPMFGGGYGQQRGDHNPPRPMSPDHPNHPDYKPGPGPRGVPYNPNNPYTHPKPKPTIPSLLDHWFNRKELEEFGRGFRELWM
tara:strand:+ start:587 stop:1036 length:450 start_codon:yes stop_codon:yes gene_type:complete